MALAAGLLSSTALPPASFAARPTEIEQQAVAAHTHDAALAVRPATQTFRGVVDSIDEGGIERGQIVIELVRRGIWRSTRSRRRAGFNA